MTSADPLIQRRARQLIVVAGIALVALATTYLLLVRTRAGQRFDDLAFDGRGVEDPEITRATNDLLHLVTRTTLAALTLAIVVLALLRRRLRLAVTAGAAITASVVTTEVLKLRLLDRPDLDGIAGIEQNSFPSGHATIGMALSLGLVLVTPHASRWLATLAATSISAIFGIGVLATGWHRPSDTIGAYLVCVIMFSVATAVLLRVSSADIRDQMGELEERLDGRASLMLGGALALAGVAALVATFRRDGLRTVEFAADYGLVAVVVIALGVAIVVGANELLRGISLDPPSRRRSLADASLSASVNDLTPSEHS